MCNGNVDTVFVERILKKYRGDDSIKIRKIKTVPACEKGENFMSVVMRYIVDGNKSVNDEMIDFTTFLIIKRPYQSELLQEAYRSNEIFMNEVIAYNEIIPTLKQNFKLSLPTADCLYADKDLIVLEDLSADGYEMRRNEISMGTEHCISVVQELAIFHSASIVLNHHDPKRIHFLSEQIMEIYRPDNEAIIDLVDKNLSVALTLLRSIEQSDKVIKAIETIENYKDRIYQRVCDLISTKKETSVFNHGDCWRNNILFKNGVNGVKSKLIDLQVMRCTSVAADLNYFLHINLIPEERNKNMDTFLDAYINVLRRTIAEHGLDVNKMAYTKEWLQQEMADFSVFGFMCSLWISPAFYYDKQTLPDMESLRPEELNAEYHKEFILKHMTPGLKDRIISLVLDFVNSYKF